MTSLELNQQGQGQQGSAPGLLGIDYNFQLSIFIKLLSVQITVFLILVLSFGAVFLLLACFFQLQCDFLCFILVYFILLCFIVTFYKPNFIFFCLFLAVKNPGL